MLSASFCEGAHVFRSSTGGRSFQGESVQLSSRRGRSDSCIFHGRVVSRAFQSILAAVGFLMMVAGHEVVAEEAGTSPTCTGCEGPSQGSLHPVKPPAPSKPRRPIVKAGPPVNFDGSWSGVSIGPCVLTWRWTIQIRNGVVSGSNASGHVSPAGVISGHMVVFRSTYNFIGQISGSHISGTWRET